MKYENEMKIEFDSKSQNESLARVVIATFASVIDPNIEELADVKTAVSEAVTNSIIHGYEDYPGKVYMYARIEDNAIYIEVEDYGKGIDNVEEAMQPLYTSKPNMDRSGMGFTVMEAFMDGVQVESKEGYGTKVYMKKTFLSLEDEEGNGDE